MSIEFKPTAGTVDFGVAVSSSPNVIHINDGLLPQRPGDYTFGTYLPTAPIKWYGSKADQYITFPPVVQAKLLPTYAGPTDAVLAPAQPGDAGVDLYASEDVILQPGERKLIPTGICIALPEGYEAQVRPRSGNAIKLGLTVLNSPGTIDEGYRGEIKVIALNTNPVVTSAFVDVLLDVLSGESGPEDAVEQFDLDTHDGTIKIEKGQKVAQLVIAKYARPVVKVVKELGATVRGTGGFGSTGG